MFAGLVVGWCCAIVLTMAYFTRDFSFSRGLISSQTQPLFSQQQGQGKWARSIDRARKESVSRLASGETLSTILISLENTLATASM